MSPMGSDEGHEAHESSPVAEVCRVEWLSFFNSLPKESPSFRVGRNWALP